MKMSVLAGLSAYICMGVVLSIAGEHAVAEPARDPDADRVRELHKELAGTRAAPVQESPCHLRNQYLTGEGKCVTLDLPHASAHASSLHDTKPITFKVVPDPAVMTLIDVKRCTGGKNNEVFFTVYDGNGEPIVSINQCNGKVIVAHTERLDDQARAFWRTVQKAFPDVCAVRGK